MARTRLSLLVPALLLVGVVVVLWSAVGRATDTRATLAPGAPSAPMGPMGPMGPESAAALHLRRPLPPAAAAPANAAPVQTAREALAAWHGERWPAVERELEAHGFDLDQPHAQRPWEAVAHAFEARIGLSPAKRAALARAHARWPEHLDLDFVRASFQNGSRARPADEADLAAIADLVAPANADIAARAELYGDLLDLHVQERWRSGRYVRAPVTTLGATPDTGGERGFHTESHGGDGWAVTITLTHEECPDLAEIEQEIAVLCHERDELVTGYLRAR